MDNRCPICGSLLYKKIYIQVDCPIGQRALDKAAIRKRNVQIEAVLWDYATIYCPNCSYTQRFITDGLLPDAKIAKDLAAAQELQERCQQLEKELAEANQRTTMWQELESAAQNQNIIMVHLLAKVQRLLEHGPEFPMQLQAIVQDIQSEIANVFKMMEQA